MKILETKYNLFYARLFFVLIISVFSVASALGGDGGMPFYFTEESQGPPTPLPDSQNIHSKAEELSTNESKLQTSLEALATNVTKEYNTVTLTLPVARLLKELQHLPPKDILHLLDMKTASKDQTLLQLMTKLPPLELSQQMRIIIGKLVESDMPLKTISEIIGSKNDYEFLFLLELKDKTHQPTLELLSQLDYWANEQEQAQNSSRTALRAGVLMFLLATIGAAPDVIPMDPLLYSSSLSLMLKIYGVIGGTSGVTASVYLKDKARTCAKIFLPPSRL